MIYVAISLFLIPNRSKYDIDNNNFLCVIDSYYIEGDVAKINLNCNEKISGYYYFNSIEEKKQFQKNIKLGDIIQIKGDLQQFEENRNSLNSIEKLVKDYLDASQGGASSLEDIARQFNYMLQIKELQQLGLGSRQIADKVGLAPFIIQKYERQAKRFKMTELKEALKACVEADEAVKTGRLNDVLSIELLIIERSR